MHNATSTSSQQPSAAYPAESAGNLFLAVVVGAVLALAMCMSGWLS